MGDIEAKLFSAGSEQDPGLWSPCLVPSPGQSSGEPVRPPGGFVGVSAGPAPRGRATRQVTEHAGSLRRRHAINMRVVVVGLCWKTGGISESRGRWDEGSGSVVAGRLAARSPVGECEGRQLHQSSLQGPEGLRAGRRCAGRKLCKCNISVTM